MLKHIVMWKFKDFAEGRTKAENTQKAKFLLDGLKRNIKEIKTLEVGINSNHSPDDFDLVLYSEFRSIQDFNVYQNHPEHQIIGAFINRVRLERRAVDYET